MTTPTPRIRAHRSIHDIGREVWDACAGTSNPFVSFDFLSALEDSGSATAQTGWMPQHISLSIDGTIHGVMPIYLKSHSFGEYIFDHSWADAYERAGGRYYPKLQCSVPFTPVTGPRLLCRENPDGPLTREAIEEGLVAGAIALTQEAKVSSLHITFAEKAEAQRMEAAGLLLREDVQFHWFNRNFASFDAFLDTLSSRKRKQIRKERREAQNGLVFRHLSGAELTEAHWDRFFSFYQDTGARKWGTPYLTREFFSLIGNTMQERIRMIFAEADGEIIAGALNLIGRDAIYGRYWGCSEERRFLHFETCYYQAIDVAIELGLGRVEAGAQGQHKLARGYEPCAIYSAHYLRDPGFHAAVEDFLKRERALVGHEREALRDFMPFKKTAD